MDNEKNWMLMTYYCPTHGNSGILKPVEISRKEISETFLKRAGIKKINFPEHN
tara:strand:- start:341 stop:499 length:159 start_codon:yes stop_codon:yes gene_type:complete